MKEFTAFKDNNMVSLSTDEEDNSRLILKIFTKKYKRFKTIIEKGIIDGWFKYDKKTITSRGVLYRQCKKRIKKIKI